jgi:hypothetical protein
MSWSTIMEQMELYDQYMMSINRYFHIKESMSTQQEKHMNNKKKNINLVQHLWLAHNEERIDQVLLLSIGYLWKQFDHKKIFKNEFMKDMK